MKLRNWYNQTLQRHALKKSPPPVTTPDSSALPMLSAPTNFSTFIYNAVQSVPTVDQLSNDQIHDSADQLAKLFDEITAQFGGSAKKAAQQKLRMHIHPLLQHYVKSIDDFQSYMKGYAPDKSIVPNITSKWHRKLLDKTALESWKNVIKAAANMCVADFTSPIDKAIDDSEWDALVSQHIPDYNAVVDHEPHTVNSELPAPLQRLIQDPKPSKSVSSEYFREKPRGAAGAFPKLLHDISQYVSGEPQDQFPSPYVMMKPYHQKISPSIVHYASKPITGWSAMTSRALYNAGNIGHLTEDVRAGKYKDVPLTVHAFASPSMRLASESIVEAIRSTPPQEPTQFKHKINPLHVQQVGLMDYLTNNIDRHSNNLLVDDNPDKTGYNPILGIDHSLGFQYNYTKGANVESSAVRSTPSTKRFSAETFLDHPESYISKSPALHAASQAAGGVDKDWSSLAQWWKQHGANIRNTFEQQLPQIRNPLMREHVRQNFHQRWNVINDWASDNRPLNWQEVSLFDRRVPIQHEVIPYKPMLSKELQRIRRQLPREPYKAAEVVATQAPQKAEYSDAMNALTEHLMRKMTPDQFSDFLIKNYKHPTLHVKAIAHKIIFGGRMQAGDQFLENFIGKLKQMPESFQEQFPFWDEHLKETPVQLAG